MATGVRIYVDGQSQPLEIILDAINQDFATKQPLRIGGSGGFGPPFVGTIQDVRVYARVLDREDVDYARDAGGLARDRGDSGGEAHSRRAAKNAAGVPCARSG